jgi:anaerobic magnesium-protoporphyrin IX monomethyl ester cyclase
MNIKKILLVDTPHFPRQEFEKVVGKNISQVFYAVQVKPVPIGLLYIATWLKHSFPGVDIKVLDMNNEMTIRVDNNYFRTHTLKQFYMEVFSDYLVKEQPNIVALQFQFSSSQHYMFDLIELTRKYNNGCKTVVGGNAATALADSLIENTKIDFVVRGEGELPMESICNYLSGKPSDLLGVVTKERRELDYDFVQDLDSIPYPDYELLIREKQWYFQQEGWGRKTYPDVFITDDLKYRTLAFLHSRGCPYQCIFCASHVVHGRKVRERSIQNIKNELTLYKEQYGINRVLANDDTFNLKKDRTVEILNLIAGLDMELVLPNNISMRVLDRDICEGFKKTRTKSLHIAIESGNQFIQDNVMKKRLNLNVTEKKVHLLREYNFWVRAYWVLGMPGESLETINDTIAYAQKLPVDWNVFHMATPLIGSEMYDMAVKGGYIVAQDQSNIHYERLSMDILKGQGISIQQVYNDANIRVNFLNNYNMNHGNYERAIGAFEDVARNYPFHSVAWYCLQKCYAATGDSVKAEQAAENLNRAIENTQGSELFHTYIEKVL